MKKGFWVLVGLFFVILAAGAAVILIPANKAMAPTTGGTAATTSPAGIADLITVSMPSAGARIASPLAIEGEARGNWYFEASFPVELLNASGTVIAQAPAQALGSWMTTDFVPFSLSLPFPAQPAGSKGTLILKKDNESGDPARDQSVSIPVTF